MTRSPLFALPLIALLGLSDPHGSGGPPSVRLPLDQFKFVERESGPINYYILFDNPESPLIRGRYQPSFKTAVMGYKFSGADRRATRLSWRWRAIALPAGGDECTKGRGDSAAAVYIVFRRGLRWYTLKYVWSAVGEKGAICDSIRNSFVAQDTVILQSGGPLNTWRTETIDLHSEFREHFADGDADARVPDLLGIGLMSDGDETRSESAADYADFAITR